MRRSLVIVLVLSACGSTHTPVRHPGNDAQRRLLDGSRWTWVEAECSDGALPLGQLGYENQLSLELVERGLRLTQDIELAARGCAATSVWSVEPGSQAGRWRFVPEAEVVLPPAAECGASQEAATEGSLSLSGDLLEMVVHRSAWCRGFDARFVYRRVAPKPLSPRRLVSRYVAHWNRRDAAALAELFAEGGSLVEPFTRTDDGNFKRHEGRAEVEAWYRSAFDSTAWLALRLTGLEVSDESATIARWQYMDDRLAEPLAGRNLFLFAAGEIFETELQLIDSPQPEQAGEPAAPSQEAQGEG